MLKDEAQAAAERVRQFWKERGYAVDITVVRVKAKDSRGAGIPAYEIISDLVNGLPRGYVGPLHGFARLEPTCPPRNDKPAIRPCITCEKPFESSGIGNRMCPPCLERASGKVRQT